MTAGSVQAGFITPAVKNSRGRHTTNPAKRSSHIQGITEEKEFSEPLPIYLGRDEGENEARIA
jgi:hypothetical protein